jgi:hypothetical protein
MLEQFPNEIIIIICDYLENSSRIELKLTNKNMSKKIKMYYNDTMKEIAKFY